jgi:hypothetical protein
LTAEAGVLLPAEYDLVSADPSATFGHGLEVVDGQPAGVDGMGLVLVEPRTLPSVETDPFADDELVLSFLGVDAGSSCSSIGVAGLAVAGLTVGAATLGGDRGEGYPADHTGPELVGVRHAVMVAPGR